jgi:hypothetical protein
MPQLHAIFRSVRLEPAFESFQDWLPWGRGFENLIQAKTISVPPPQSGAQFMFFYSRGPICREYSLKQMTSEKFQEIRSKGTVVGFDFTLNPDELNGNLTFSIGAMALEGPMSFMLVVPDPAPGLIDALVSENVWSMAKRWCGVPGLLRLSAQSPRGVGPFSDGTDVDLPLVSGYHWLLYLRPDVVAILGGEEFVMRAAPVERVEAINTPEGGRGVLCRIAVSPNAVSDERWQAWKDFLKPVLGTLQSGFPPNSQFCKLTPEDRAFYPDGIHV